MLYKNGKAINPDTLSKHFPTRQKQLAGVREVLAVLPPKCGAMFRLETRARVRQC